MERAGTENGGRNNTPPAARMVSGASDEEIAAVVAALRVLADESAGRRTSQPPSEVSGWARTGRLEAVGQLNRKTVGWVRDGGSRWTRPDRRVEDQR